MQRTNFCLVEKAGAPRALEPDPPTLIVRVEPQRSRGHERLGLRGDRELEHTGDVVCFEGQFGAWQEVASLGLFHPIETLEGAGNLLEVLGLQLWIEGGRQLAGLGDDQGP